MVLKEYALRSQDILDSVDSGDYVLDLWTEFTSAYPPVWHRPENEQLLLSSLHTSLSCSGINKPPAALSAPMCSSESVQAHNSQVVWPFAKCSSKREQIFNNFSVSVLFVTFV